MSLFSDFVPKSCSVILSLLKYANENTKRGTKSLNNYKIMIKSLKKNTNNVILPVSVALN